MTRLRVLSYNVRSLRDDPVAVGRVMRSVDPDVVVVQEAPRFARWRSHAASIARRGGLVVVTGGRTAAGNLLLAHLRVDVHAVSDVLLSPVPGLHRRGVALAVLGLGGTRFAVGGTHLDLAEPARLLHVGELRETLGRFAPGLPTLLAGDVNDVPGSAVWTALEQGATDVFAAAGAGAGETFDTADPSRRIDAVFASAGFHPVSARVLDTADVRIASDHRPLLVELDVRSPAPH